MWTTWTLTDLHLTLTRASKPFRISCFRQWKENLDLISKIQIRNQSNQELTMWLTQPPIIKLSIMKRWKSKIQMKRTSQSQINSLLRSSKGHNNNFNNLNNLFLISLLNVIMLHFLFNNQMSPLCKEALIKIIVSITTVLVHRLHALVLHACNNKWYICSIFSSNSNSSICSNSFSSNRCN